MENGLLRRVVNKFVQCAHGKKFNNCVIENRRQISLRNIIREKKVWGGEDNDNNSKKVINKKN